MREEVSGSDAARRVAEGVWVGGLSSGRGRAGGERRLAAAIGGTWWVRCGDVVADVGAVIVGADAMVVAFVAVSGSMEVKTNRTVARRHWTTRAFDVRGECTATRTLDALLQHLSVCHAARLRELVGGVFFQERVVEARVSRALTTWFT